MWHGNALAFDTTLREIFRGKLLTPADLKTGKNGTYATPRDRVIAEGWPTVREMRGKAMALFAGGEAYDLTSSTEPNQTLRLYLDRLHESGFDEPAAFVCPRVFDAKIGAPDGFLVSHETGVSSQDNARLMGNVVCNSIFTGQHRDKTATWDVSFDSSLATLKAAHAANLLTYFWGYEDPLANYPEVAMELIRNGANIFDMDKGDAATLFDSPVMFETLKLYNWEGVSGITGYGMVLRQRNNPSYVMTRLADDTVGLAPYSGAASQQWAFDASGQIFSLSDQSKCIGVTAADSKNLPWFPFPPHPGAIFPYLSPYVYKVKLAEASTTHLVPCLGINPYDLTSFTITAAVDWNVPSTEDEPRRPPRYYGPTHQQLMADNTNSLTGGHVNAVDGGDDRDADHIGLLLMLSRDKQVGNGTLFLSPTSYTGDASIQTNWREHYRIPLQPSGPVAGAQSKRAPDGTFRQEFSSGGNESNDVVYRQEFEILFDKTNAVAVNGVPVPPKDKLANGTAVATGLVPPRTWRSYALTAANVVPVANDGLLSQQDKDLWYYAYQIDSGQSTGTPGQITNGTLPWWALPRFYVTDDDARTQHVTYATAAAAFMSPSEFSKWKSASMWPAAEYPNDGSTDAYYMLSLMAGSQEAIAREMPVNSPSYGQLAYWQAYNDKEIWWPIKNILSDAEYRKWFQRLQFTPKDIALDPTVEYVAKQLLETDERPHFYVASAQPEINQYFYERGYTCKMTPQGVDPVDVCGSRFLTRSLGSDGHYHQNNSDGLYHWNMLPFSASYQTFAEAAFNPPDPALASHKQPNDWTLWSAAAALHDSVGNRPLTYKDVPLGEPYHTIVVGSTLLDPVQQQQFLEKERLASLSSVGYLDIDPDSRNYDLAKEKLSDADFSKWLERVAVTLDDVPNSLNFYQSPAAAKLLSSDELKDLYKKVGPHEGSMNDPVPPNPPLPTVWTDIPPARTKRLVAETLLDANQYLQWQKAAAANADDFPQVYSNDAINELALDTLSADEYHDWRNRIEPNPPQPAQLNWLMCPHWATSIAICNALLAPDQAKIWDDMISYPMLYQYLGGSSQMSIYAKSALDGSQYANWQAYATQLNRPLTYEAFQFDRSVLQEQIVKIVFGANSTDYAAWRSWAGR
jgi:hypothetical protein